MKIIDKIRDMDEYSKLWLVGIAVIVFFILLGGTANYNPLLKPILPEVEKKYDVGYGFDWNKLIYGDEKHKNKPQVFFMSNSDDDNVVVFVGKIIFLVVTTILLLLFINFCVGFVLTCGIIIFNIYYVVFGMVSLGVIYLLNNYYKKLLLRDDDLVITFLCACILLQHFIFVGVALFYLENALTIYLCSIVLSFYLFYSVYKYHKDILLQKSVTKIFDKKTI